VIYYTLDDDLLKIFRTITLERKKQVWVVEIGSKGKKSLLVLSHKKRENYLLCVTLTLTGS
jgi:hypothetical protein